MPRALSVFVTGVVILLFVVPSTASAAETKGTSELLRENWFIQSSAEVHADGSAISKPGFSADNWYPATLPTTVLSALVKDQVYPDPYTGMNLRTIPGTTYPIFEDFSNVLMPPASPFRPSWWYRTEFNLPVEYKGKTIWLGFDGINYRANVWMNGVQVANSEDLAGTWRLFPSTSLQRRRPALQTHWQLKSLLLGHAILRSLWLIGLLCLPTRRWGSGGMCIFTRPVRLRCVTPRC
jgi:exo-1,4-beta-D-glucosaminidase